MSEVVVECNVAVVANGRDTHASVECQLACIRELKRVVNECIVAVDSHGYIFDEYKRHLNFSGQPGVGDGFFRYLHQFHYNADKIARVPITLDDDEKGFSELPKNELDPSDRKFLAVAVVAKAEVLNATDSDWEENRALIEELDVKVIQLCPEHQ